MKVWTALISQKRIRSSVWLLWKVRSFAAILGRQLAVEPELVGPVHEVALSSPVLETGNSVGTLRRSLLVSRMLGALADGADHEHVVAGEVEHLLGQLVPFLRAELGEAELALPVEVAFPLLGRLDAGQLAAVVGQLAFAALDQPASGFPTRRSCRSC